MLFILTDTVVDILTDIFDTKTASGWTVVHSYNVTKCVLFRACLVRMMILNTAIFVLV